MSHLMSLSRVKRTWDFALHMSAFDPKRTLRQFGPYLDRGLNLYDPPVSRLESGNGDEAARLPCVDQCGPGGNAAYGARAAAGTHTSHWGANGIPRRR